MSKIFNSVVETIEQNKSIKESGGIIAILGKMDFKIVNSYT